MHAFAHSSLVRAIVLCVCGFILLPLGRTGSRPHGMNASIQISNSKLDMRIQTVEHVLCHFS